MLFKCGPSFSDRLYARRRLRKKWRSWFAWHPVRIGAGVDGVCAWLEYVERREDPCSGYEGWSWEYRVAADER